MNSCKKGFYKKEFDYLTMCCPCAEGTYQQNDGSQETSCTVCDYPKRPNPDHDDCKVYPTFQGCEPSTHVPVKIMMEDAGGWPVSTRLEVKKRADTQVVASLRSPFSRGYDTACLPKLDGDCRTVELAGGAVGDYAGLRWAIIEAGINCKHPPQLELKEDDDDAFLRVCEVSSLIGGNLTGTHSTSPIYWCDVDQCPVGKFRVTSATNTDYSLNDIVNSCAPCVEGTFSSSVGDSPCSVCPLGKISASRGQSICIDCEVGKYNNDEATDRQLHVECLACGSGRYAAAAGSHECTICQTNQFNAESIAGECTECR